MFVNISVKLCERKPLKPVFLKTGATSIKFYCLLCNHWPANLEVELFILQHERGLSDAAPEVQYIHTSVL